MSYLTLALLLTAGLANVGEALTCGQSLHKMVLHFAGAIACFFMFFREMEL
jgi:hypothetical protein